MSVFLQIESKYLHPLQILGLPSKYIFHHILYKHRFCAVNFLPVTSTRSITSTGVILKLFENLIALLYGQKCHGNDILWSYQCYIFSKTLFYIDISLIILVFIVIDLERHIQMIRMTLFPKFNTLG